MVFQIRQSICWSDCWRWCCFWFGKSGTFSSRNEKKRVEEALALVGMLDFKREPARLSGGQKKQRVAIAGVCSPKTSYFNLRWSNEYVWILKGVETYWDSKEFEKTMIWRSFLLPMIWKKSPWVIAYWSWKKREVNQLVVKGLSSRNDLDQIGLDDPFANQLKKNLWARMAMIYLKIIWQKVS